VYTSFMTKQRRYVLTAPVFVAAVLAMASKSANSQTTLAEVRLPPRGRDWAGRRRRRGKRSVG